MLTNIAATFLDWVRRTFRTVTIATSSTRVTVRLPVIPSSTLRRTMVAIRTEQPITRTRQPPTRLELRFQNCCSVQSQHHFQPVTVMEIQLVCVVLSVCEVFLCKIETLFMLSILLKFKFNCKTRGGKFRNCRLAVFSQLTACISYSIKHLKYSLVNIPN